MTDKVITAAELGKRLLDYGDIPVKLRIGDGNDDWLAVTILTNENCRIDDHSASGTAWGDYPLVARITVHPEDNA